MFDRLPLSANLRGALCFIFGTAFLVTNDTLVKLQSAEMPIGQLIFVRGWFAVAFTLLACWWLGVLDHLKDLANRAVMARAGVNAVSMFTYMAALIHMPIANVATIMQVIPLALTAASALLLAERVGVRRWTAVAVGFIGVLIVIRPGPEGFNVWALSALLTVGLVVTRDLITRSVSAGIPSILITLASSIAVLVSAGVYSAAEEWAPLTLSNVSVLVASAGFLTIGIHLLIVAVRIGELSVVVPFRYLLVVWAMISGYLVWDELPDGWALFGIALVVGSGIYTVRREAKVRKTAAKEG